jgi:hypothetical protein
MSNIDDETKRSVALWRAVSHCWTQAGDELQDKDEDSDFVDDDWDEPQDENDDPDFDTNHEVAPMHSISEEAAAEIETLSADNLRLRAEIFDIQDTAWTVVALVEAAQDVLSLTTPIPDSDSAYVPKLILADLRQALATFDALNKQEANS